MTSSQIPAVKGALRDLWNTQTGQGGTLAGVKVKWGVVHPPKAEQIEIWSGKGQRTFRAIGNHPTPLDEELAVEVIISVVQSKGTDYEAAESRMWAIVAAMEDLYRTDPTLGGILIFGSFSAADQQYFTVDRQHGSRVTVTVSGKARIP
jgi:hypothetical protein